MPWTRACGCARLEALATSGKPESTQKVERKAAERLRERWGCGRARSLPLAKTEADLAAAFERLVGAPRGSCDGCPFEGIYDPRVTGGWLAELLGARVLVVDEHLSWADALERPLHHVDVVALRWWKTASTKLLAIKPKDNTDRE